MPAYYLGVYKVSDRIDGLVFVAMHSAPLMCGDVACLFLLLRSAEDKHVIFL